MKRGRGDVGVRMMHEGGDSDYTGGSICLTDTLPFGNKKQIKIYSRIGENLSIQVLLMSTISLFLYFYDASCLDEYVCD